MDRFTCTFIRTRPKVDDFTRTCAAKKPRRKRCLSDYDERLQIPNRRKMASGRTSRHASKWATGRMVQSLAQITTKPSWPWSSARAGMPSCAKFSTKAPTQAFGRTSEDLDGRQRERICVPPPGELSAGHSDLLRWPVLQLATRQQRKLRRLVAPVDIKKRRMDTVTEK